MLNLRRISIFSLLLFAVILLPGRSAEAATETVGSTAEEIAAYLKTIRDQLQNCHGEKKCIVRLVDGLLPIKDARIRDSRVGQIVRDTYLGKITYCDLMIEPNCYADGLRGLLAEIQTTFDIQESALRPRRPKRRCVVNEGNIVFEQSKNSASEFEDLIEQIIDVADAGTCAIQRDESCYILETAHPARSDSVGRVGSSADPFSTYQIEFSGYRWSDTSRYHHYSYRPSVYIDEYGYVKLGPSTSRVSGTYGTEGAEAEFKAQRRALLASGICRREDVNYLTAPESL